MENWEYKLAGEFKSRDNPKPLGACIGKVESLEPVIISIQSGKFITKDGTIDFAPGYVAELFASYPEAFFLAFGFMFFSGLL